MSQQKQPAPPSNPQDYALTDQENFEVDCEVEAEQEAIAEEIFNIDENAIEADQRRLLDDFQFE
jgi:hypothetical protein